jgi:hypothetical protein
MDSDFRGMGQCQFRLAPSRPAALRGNFATTGQRCGNPASIWIVRFGERFNLCAECALRDYFRPRSTRNNRQNSK